MFSGEWFAEFTVRCSRHGTLFRPIRGCPRCQAGDPAAPKPAPDDNDKAREGMA